MWRKPNKYARDYTFDEQKYCTIVVHMAILSKEILEIEYVYV